MYRVPRSKPSPDFDAFERVLKGEIEPARVHFVELGIDAEVVKYISENYLDRKWVPPTEEDGKEYLEQQIGFYLAMGYDYCPLWVQWRNLPRFRERRAADTAALSRGERTWVDERGGIIKNWEDFENIHWDNVTHDLSALDHAQEMLPDGMKVTVGCTVFEMILERFLGYQDLFILSEDDPELVEAVFERWGQKVYHAYEEAIQYPGVGAVFHADDLGFKTSTLLSPTFLRKNVFPWFKRFAALAHERGKTYWYHCCGNVREVMDDLVDDVRIDAFHSFQDVIMPVAEFSEKYGYKVAALGGVDMDKLARMNESELREYVRDILSDCMPGRFALGSGNTVANYLPPENYLAMLDEGLRWEG